MKLTIEKNDLLNLANTAVSVVANRNTIPILANVLLDASEHTLKATATDLDRQIDTKVQAHVHGPGRATVNAKMLADIAKAIKDGALIEASTDEGYLHIKAGRAKYKLATLSADDFPIMERNDYQATLSMPALELANILRKTVWAASSEETRYYLQGVAIQKRDSGAVAVATDGHRLARFNFQTDEDWQDVIIPAKTVNEFIRVATDGDAVLSISETKVRLECGNTTVTSKLIDGTYPEWSRVIPKGHENAITASSGDLKDAISRVVLVSSERTRAVKLVVDGGTLGIHVQGGDGGQADESLDVDQKGANVTIGLNSKYGLEALNRADKGDVTIRYGDSLAPVLIEYASEPDLLAVLMPMRV